MKSMKIELTTQGGRLQYFINQLNLTQVEFGISIGQPKAVINRIVNNRKEITPKILQSIKQQYPALNASWLHHNIGTSGIDKEVRLIKETYYIEKIANLEAEIERLSIENKALKQ